MGAVESEGCIGGAVGLQPVLPSLGAFSCGYVVPSLPDTGLGGNTHCTLVLIIGTRSQIGGWQHVLEFAEGALESSFGGVGDKKDQARRNGRSPGPWHRHPT
jgi:hypothetical protein